MTLPSITVYCFNEDGYFLHTDIAVESPLERGSGKFIMPENSTDVQPPSQVSVGKVLRWSKEHSSWSEVEIPTQYIEIMGRKIRDQRNRLLAACDWTQLGDIMSSMPIDRYAQWIEYRKALRDITAQGSFPLTVVWPLMPQ